ncbi:AMP-binding enzyme, partial [Pararhodobacter aggregans]|uniref:AMP-binding enzyme n=1 Tax=Pararhodobacter aggregans TaxID=404875 RepID=UPI003A932C9C
ALASRPRQRGAVGQPVIWVDLRIVGPEGRDVPTGAVGEMWLRGPNLIRSYWNNPPGSENAFVDGWFRSGDMARLDDEGFLFIVDRLKDMYISGGENVYPAEVERVLQQVEGIREVAVFGVPHPRWGETGHAAVVLAPGSTLDEERIIAICREALARYKLPSGVTFLEALPRNATGKIQKNVLRERFSPAEAQE